MAEGTDAYKCKSVRVRTEHGLIEIPLTNSECEKYMQENLGMSMNGCKRLDTISLYFLFFVFALY